MDYATAGMALGRLFQQVDKTRAAIPHVRVTRITLYGRHVPDTGNHVHAHATVTLHLDATATEREVHGE